MQLSRLNPVWFLKIYIFLNLFKAVLGIILGRNIITAISIIISLSLFLAYLLIDLFNARIEKRKAFSFILMFIFTVHLIISIGYLRSADLYPTLVSFFQITTPMLFLFVLDSLTPGMVKDLTRFLLICLIPFIVFAFIEIILPLPLRERIYIGFSYLVTGEGQIDVSYYLGDTAYSGLRLGSLFFEPLTFAFVSTFLTIYLFSKRKKHAFVTLTANILALGKLPIATTFISLGSYIFKRFYNLYYTFIAMLIIGVLVYFVKNAEEIAINSPSLGTHMLGLAYGLLNAMEAPLIGHGFGTGGYVSYLYYLKKNEDGPFTGGLGGLMNGNESAVGSIAYQLGYVMLFVFILFFVVYFIRLVKLRQIMMASGVVGYILSLFLSESVLTITIVSVLLILSKSLIIERENPNVPDH